MNINSCTYLYTISSSTTSLHFSQLNNSVTLYKSMSRLYFRILVFDIVDVSLQHKVTIIMRYIVTANDVHFCVSSTQFTRAYLTVCVLGNRDGKIRLIKIYYKQSDRILANQ